jgi:hypothetical protein
MNDCVFETGFSSCVNLLPGVLFSDQSICQDFEQRRFKATMICVAFYSEKINAERLKLIEKSQQYKRHN